MFKKFMYTSALLSTLALTTAVNAHAEGERISETYSSIGAPVAQLDRQVASVTTASVTAKTPQELKAVVYDNLKQLNTKFTVRYTGDTSKFKAVSQDIFNKISLEDDYLNGVLSNYGFSSNGYVNDITVNYSIGYNHTKTQEQYITQKIKQITTSIINPSMTDVEKVKAINDYIVLNSSYSFSTKTSPHSLYTILNEGKGVCQAYALFAYRLLMEAGFEVRYVTGYAGEAHAWNLVKVDGQWYHLDTTWNDPLFSSNAGDRKDYIQYKYFLLSDAQIKKDHRIDANGYPAATSTRFTAWHGISEPVQVNDTLYYANQNDNIQLYKLNMNASAYNAEKVSKVRVQHLTYANGWLYFANYSNSGYLYKSHLDGSNLTKLADYDITKITKTADKLIAYSGNKQVYTTAITAEQSNDKDETTASKEVATFTQQAQQLVVFSKDFKQQAEALIASYNRLPASAKQALSKEAIAQLETAKIKLEQLSNVAYPNSKQWRDKQYVTNPRKKWTISFNQSIQAGTDLSKHVWMEDMFGEKIATTVNYANGQITITPLSDLHKDVTYTVVINNTLKNADGKSLKQAFHLPFEVNK